MSEIVKGVLGGGWSLVAGWVLPSAVNTVLFSFLVLPSLRDIDLVADVAAASAEWKSLVLLTAALIVGLVLSALKTPLFRVLEGYLGWPARAQAWGRRRHLNRSTP